MEMCERAYCGLSLSVERWRLVNGNPRVGESRAPFDEVSGLLGDHHGRSVQVPADDTGHNGGVDDTQPLQAQHPCVWVDDGHGVGGRAHFAGAGRVVGGVCFASDKGVDVSV